MFSTSFSIKTRFPVLNPLIIQMLLLNLVNKSSQLSFPG